MKTYSSIEELTLTLALYLAQKECILEEAGNKFELDGEDAFFVVAKDGNCALFDKDCKIDDLSKIKTIVEDVVRKDITSINIPDSVESIGKQAFTECESLKEIIFKGKTLGEVKSMRYYPQKIKDTSIIKCEVQDE